MIVLIGSRVTSNLDPFHLLTPHHFITHSHFAPVYEATNLTIGIALFHYTDNRFVLPLGTASWTTMILKWIIVIHIHSFIIFSKLILLTDRLFVPCHGRSQFCRREDTIQCILLRWRRVYYYWCCTLGLQRHIRVATSVVTSKIRLRIHSRWWSVQWIIRGKVHSSVQRDTIAKRIAWLKGFWELDGRCVSCANLEPWNLGCRLRWTYFIYLRQWGCRVLMIEYALSWQPLIFERCWINFLLYQWSSPSNRCPLAVISHEHRLIRIVNISCLIEWSQHLLLQP